MTIDWLSAAIGGGVVGAAMYLGPKLWARLAAAWTAFRGK